MVLAIGACGRFMALSLAARAMPWHSRVRGCLFFCGFVECGVRPLFRVSPTSPNIDARGLHRARDSEGGGIGVWP
jgi:hypothetical protein